MCVLKKCTYWETDFFGGKIKTKKCWKVCWFTIGNVDFTFFNEKLMISPNKIHFSIDNRHQIFPCENHFCYWGNHFQQNFDVKKSFLSVVNPWSTLPPPSTVAVISSKSAKIFHMGVLKKTRKTEKAIAKRLSWKFRQKIILWCFRRTFQKISHAFKG